VETAAGRLLADRLGITPAPVLGAEYALPGSVDPKDVYRTIALSYVQNRRFLATACQAYGVICLFVLQPVPFVEYDRSHDPVVDTDDLPGLVLGYPMIKAALKDEQWFYPLDDVFRHPAEFPYVDKFHYTPYGSDVIGDLIYRKVAELIQEVRN
jgi:hypothetical protein